LLGTIHITKTVTFTTLNMAAETTQKPMHSLILDTGPLIKNVVSISTIINSAEELYTTPAIISEIRDEATRARVQTTLMPFLKVRNPSPASYEAVTEFSKKTGDHAVLSRQDMGILALAYEIHCERNGGSWGLREVPKGPIKKRPEEIEEEAKAAAAKAAEIRATEPKAEKAQESAEQEQAAEVAEATEADQAEPEGEWSTVVKTKKSGKNSRNQKNAPKSKAAKAPAVQEPVAQEPAVTEQLAPEVQADQQTSEPAAQEAVPEPVEPEAATATTTEASDANSAPETLEKEVENLNISTPADEQQEEPIIVSEDEDSDGEWITPSNLPEHQAKDSGLQADTRTQKQQMDVATMTIDFAMQNVLLQMNLNLLSTNMQRIKKLTSKVLRCHACFNIVKDMSKQFCPRCGGATLSRVSCSTNAKGEFRVHLAKNYTYNKRGDRYSIPKPIAGTANTKWSGIGGGKGGWGRDLILAEDQKEYQKQVVEDKRTQTKDLMDQDYLPGILTGDRGRAGGRPKVGAGKTANSRKRV
jgi:RNA-binding protein NOB1